MLSGSELRRLLVLRGRLRETIVGAPRTIQRDVLRALEEARRARQHGHAPPWIPPDMARDELVREIKWRLDAASLVEVDAADRVMERARRRLTARTGPGTRSAR
jgi:hypothetical protein